MTSFRSKVQGYALIFLAADPFDVLRQADLANEKGYAGAVSGASRNGISFSALTGRRA
jgi:hypothetical protein